MKKCPAISWYHCSVATTYGLKSVQVITWIFRIFCQKHSCWPRQSGCCCPLFWQVRGHVFFSFFPNHYNSQKSLSHPGNATRICSHSAKCILANSGLTARVVRFSEWKRVLQSPHSILTTRTAVAEPECPQIQNKSRFYCQWIDFESQCSWIFQR